jgi:hypothetical protein
VHPGHDTSFLSPGTFSDAMSLEESVSAPAAAAATEGTPAATLPLVSSPSGRLRLRHATSSSRSHFLPHLLQRFRINRIVKDKPYIIAEVEDFPDEEGACPVTAAPGQSALYLRLACSVCALVSVCACETTFACTPRVSASVRARTPPDPK